MTASQGQKLPAAANAMGNAAVAAGKGIVKGGKATVSCIGAACKAIGKKVTGHRSIDSPVRRGLEIPDEDVAILSRYAEPEPEAGEDAPLLSRYAEPEPESDFEDLY